MGSRAKRRKEQKRKARRKAYEKQRNKERNKPSARFRLEVKVDGDWCVGKMLRAPEDVEAHIQEVEAQRKRGDVEIVEGRIIDLKSCRMVSHIPAYSPSKPGPSMKDAAMVSKKSDKNLEDGV